MSSHFSVYVGPYARCENTAKKVTRQVRTCPTVTCERHGMAHSHVIAFCATCGGKLERMSIERDGWLVSVGDVYEAFHDRMREIGSSDVLNLWISNSSKDGHGETYDCEAGELADGENIKTEVAAFKSAFASELGHLRALYGDDKVEVRWGVIGEWR